MKKKFLIPFILAFITVALLLNGCSAAADSALTDLQSTQPESDTQSDQTSAPDAKPVSAEPEKDWFAFTVGGNWNSEGNFTDVVILRSVSELNKYFIETSTGGYFDRERYDDAFFAEYCLILTGVTEGSGSVRHKVTSVAESEGKLRIEIDRHIPGVATDDLAYCLIFIEADKKLADLEAEVVFNNVRMDYSVFSPAFEDLISAEFSGSKRGDGSFGHISNILFRFKGRHESFHINTLTEFEVTRDGEKLDIGFYIDMVYKWDFENDETKFFLKISPKQNQPGLYAFSCNYFGNALKTEPVTVVDNGSSVRGQLGLGGLTADDISGIKFTRGYYGEKPADYWYTSDTAQITEMLEYFDGLEGERFSTNVFDEFSLDINFIMRDGSEIVVSVSLLNEYHSDLMDADRKHISFKISNAKTEAEWAEFLAQCSKSEPVTVVESESSVLEQHGLGGLTADDILKITFTGEYFGARPAETWEITDPEKISEFMENFESFPGDLVDNNFGYFSLELLFLLKDSRVVGIRAVT